MERQGRGRRGGVLLRTTRRSHGGVVVRAELVSFDPRRLKGILFQLVKKGGMEDGFKCAVRVQNGIYQLVTLRRGVSHHHPRARRVRHRGRRGRHHAGELRRERRQSRQASGGDRQVALEKIKTPTAMTTSIISSRREIRAETGKKNKNK